MERTALATRLLQTAAANRTLGVRVVRADATGAEVALATGESLANAIGSLHASGLIALIDAAGLAAMVGSCRAEAEFEGLTPLGTMASLQFLAPARGPLIARCSLAPFERSALRELLDGRVRTEELETCAEVLDRDGTVVCRGRFTWKLRRAHVVTGAHGRNGVRATAP